MVDPNFLPDYKRRYHAAREQANSILADALMATYREITNAPHDDKLWDEFFNVVRFK